MQLLSMVQQTKVVFANLNYAFMQFQVQYKTLCQEISENHKKNIYKSFKLAKSFIYEYLNYVKEDNIKNQILKEINRINNKLMNDTTYSKLSKDKTSVDNIILFNQTYYYYLIDIFKLLGIFGDELTSTFMPHRTDRQKLFKYRNDNPFFEQFIPYKSMLSQRLGVFSIFEFKHSFDFMLGFYYAYYSFIDESSRLLIEKVYSDLLSIVLSDKVLSMIIKGFSSLDKADKVYIRKIDNIIHDSLLNIFNKANYSYSLFGIMPTIEDKITIDRTTI